MLVKRQGYYVTLRNSKEYKLVRSVKNSDGTYTIKSNDPSDLNNGFTKYSEKTFIKTVPESDIKRIEYLEPYATLKEDPDKNKFMIIEKNNGHDDQLLLCTTDGELANRFGFGPCSYGRGTYEKGIDESTAIIGYDKELIFPKQEKKIRKQIIKNALGLFGKTPTTTSEICLGPLKNLRAF